MFNRQVLRTIIPIIIVLLAISMAFAGKDYEWKKKMISANRGGQITLSKGTKVIFPSKCLSEDTLVRVERNTIDNKKVEFYFEPHGTQFLKPVEIQLSWATLKDLTSDDLILYYYDEENGQWIEETNAVWDEKGKKATLYINHFSYYYFARR